MHTECKRRIHIYLPCTSSARHVSSVLCSEYATGICQGRLLRRIPSQMHHPSSSLKGEDGTSRTSRGTRVPTLSESKPNTCLVCIPRSDNRNYVLQALSHTFYLSKSHTALCLLSKDFRFKFEVNALFCSLDADLNFQTQAVGDRESSSLTPLLDFSHSYGPIHLFSCTSNCNSYIPT
jgi:hypothetical protein